MDVAKSAKLVAEKKQNLKDKEYYDKYINIFTSALRFLRTQEVLMYGGQALNHYLPDKNKIYDKYTLPDIDVLSSTPKSVATALMEHLNAEKYRTVSMSKSLTHNGTFKVFAEGLPVADISYVHNDIMHSLAKGGTRGLYGLKCVSPVFVKLTLHAMLAIESVERWEKTALRMGVFYKVFPPRIGSLRVIEVKPDAEIDYINNSVHVYTEELHNCVLIGTPVISMFLDRKVAIGGLKNIPYNVFIVDSDPYVFAITMAKELVRDGIELEVTNMYPGNDILLQPQHVIVTDKVSKIPIAVVFHTHDRCLSYNVYKGRKVGTIHLALMIYMGMQLSTYTHFKTMRTSLEYLTDVLSKVHTTTHNNTKVFKRLSLTCMGIQQGLATMRRVHFDAH